MTLQDQYETLKSIQTAIKSSPLNGYIRMKITHCKASLAMPERYRAWIYANGYVDELDGKASPWLLETSWIESNGEEWLAEYLNKIAAQARVVK